MKFGARRGNKCEAFNNASLVESLPVPQIDPTVAATGKRLKIMSLCSDLARAPRP
jgi:ArsR family metal-binding transcriptional regulator